MNKKFIGGKNIYIKIKCYVQLFSKLCLALLNLGGLVARPLQRRRLQAQGLPSYTNAPRRWSAGLLRICEERGHG